MGRTKKYAINKCYGGFSLSHEAILRLVERESELVKTFPDNGVKLTFEEEVRDGYTAGFGSFIKKDGICYDIDEDDRSHPDLISIIEEMGEGANGQYAKIGIVEVPEDVEVTVEEYDGMEHLAEVHRQWY